MFFFYQNVSSLLKDGLLRMFVQNLEVGYYSGNTSFHEDLF